MLFHCFAIIIFLIILMMNFLKNIVAIITNNLFILQKRTSCWYFQGAAGLLATGGGAWIFVGSPGIAYGYGVTEVFLNSLFIICLILCVACFASSLRIRASRFGSLSIPEYMARLHSDPNTNFHLFRRLLFFFGMSIVIPSFLFLLAQYKALVLTFVHVFGENFGSLLSSCFVLFMAWYVARGGFCAVLIADSIMFVFIFICSAYFILEIFVYVGLSELLLESWNISEDLVNPSSLMPYGDAPWFTVMCFFAYAFVWPICTPYMAIRFMYFPKEVQWHKFIVALCLFGMVLLPVPFMGMLARIKFPELQDVDYALLTYVQSFGHPFWQWFVMLTIVLSAQSTINSLLHLMGDIFCCDMLWSWRSDSFESYQEKKKFKHREDNVARHSIWFIALLVLIVFPWTKDWSLSYVSLVSCSLLLTLLAPDMLLPWLSRQGAAILIIISVCFGFVFNAIAWFLDSRYDIGWIVVPVLCMMFVLFVYVVLVMLSFFLEKCMGNDWGSL